MLKTFILFILSSLMIISNSFAQESELVIPLDDITKEELLTIQPDDFIVGNEDAPVTIIEYASMSCSHCAEFHLTTYPKIKEKYINTGKVKFTFRDFPLDEPALRGAMLKGCDTEKKEKFMHVLFSTRESWTRKKNYIEILENIAKLGGVTGDKFQACMADEELENKILESRMQANTKLDVRSTPTFFINGELIRGAINFNEFSNIIDKKIDILEINNIENQN